MEPTLDGSDFLEYLELQGSLDMVSKSELLEAVRASGRRVSDRQLISYITEGLMPRSARIGSRSGAFPKITIELLEWISDARDDRGLSVDAVRELLPLWRLLQRGIRDQRIDLAEVQLVARQHVRKREAAYSVPWVVQWTLPCPIHEVNEMRELTFVFKDGSEHTMEDIDPLGLGFVIQREDEDAECAKPVAWMRIDLTPVDSADPSVVVLSLPQNGPTLDDKSDSDEVSQGSAKIASRAEVPQLT
jgi:DNA-binding transcriptional MerR regulator